MSITHDIKEMKPVIIASDKGGHTLSEIEKLYPESITKIYIDHETGV